MVDKGALDLGEGGDLSVLRITADGYSSVRRAGVTLYPLKTDAGQLYFSRKPVGDVRLLVDYAVPETPEREIA